MEMKILRATKDDIKKYLDQIGNLRIEVFKEWPYLYEGDLGYERKYLSTYLDAKNAACFLLFHNDQVVGATTAISMLEADQAFSAPLKSLDINLNDVMYFGESIIKNEFRGGGWGNKFFELREAFATEKGFTTSMFCSVNRAENHPLKPRDYKNLNNFWKRIGYQEHTGVTVEFKWKNLGEDQESAQKLTLWSKKLGPSTDEPS